jgi:hypothetical protein
MGALFLVLVFFVLLILLIALVAVSAAGGVRIVVSVPSTATVAVSTALAVRVAMSAAVRRRRDVTGGLPLRLALLVGVVVPALVLLIPLGHPAGWDGRLIGGRRVNRIGRPGRRAALVGTLRRWALVGALRRRTLIRALGRRRTTAVAVLLLLLRRRVVPRSLSGSACRSRDQSGRCGDNRWGSGGGGVLPEVARSNFSRMPSLSNDEVSCLKDIFGESASRGSANQFFAVTAAVE